ncbi:MAG: ParB/RepB/Spo0J family partition protein [Firmicutes bacterium]|jgi:ParB family chromosome partitioning protein|nr:ParB/RepB/Spo0J family partition protein [Bacillota bacterium]
MAVKHRGLGRGLESLIPQMAAAEEKPVSIEVPTDSLSPNPFQPRRSFDKDKLEELASSIRKHGLLQPIVVRPAGGGYEIIAGERRWRASQMAGLSTIPATVRELSDSEMIQVALIENLQRQDLDPMEEAHAYRRLMDEFGMTQEALSEALGRSRSAIANSVRLLNLPEEIQQIVSRGTISGGHARTLLGISDRALQERVARQVAEKGLTVRQTEELVRRLGRNVSRETIPPRRALSEDPDVAMLTHQLEERLGTRVRLSGSASKGKLEIEYYSPEDLDRIMEIILDTQQVRNPGQV